MSEKIYPIPEDIKKMLSSMRKLIISGIKKASMIQKASGQNRGNALNGLNLLQK